MLVELLRMWDETLERHAPASWASLAPGLARTDISRRLEALGIAAPEELIVWWEWHNGHLPGVQHGLRPAQMSLSQAESDYMGMSLGHGPDQWDSHWVEVAGEGWKWSIAVRCATAGEVVVRGISPELGVTTHGDHPTRQAISLCTLVVLWLHAIDAGWYRANEQTGFLDYSWDGMPAEWLHSGLV